MQDYIYTVINMRQETKMIESIDIKSIIESGEGYNAEFKVSVPSKVREITEQVCAFANSAGGVIILGVNDKNEIKGTTIDNAKRAAVQNSMSEISPELNCRLEIIEVEGKKLGIIEVPTGPDKPYVYSGAIYVRNGAVTQKLTTAEQMRNFFNKSGKILFDEAECAKFDPKKDIDQTIMAEFRAVVPISEGINDDQIFANFKMLSLKEKFKNGSVLFFGKDPQKYFDNAVLRCVAFDGINKRYIVDDKIYDGPLLSQLNQAVYWLKKKLDVRYEIETQGFGPRLEHWEIPENVFKEAIINSLCHRDYYEKGSTIIVELFDDRVEITNPGGLVSAISKEEFGTKSYSRNPLIFGLFTRMHLVEQVGSGIMRMRNMMIKAGLPEPEYKTKGMFTIIMRRPGTIFDKQQDKQQDKLTPSQEKILKEISINPSIIASDLSNIIGLHERNVYENIRKLIELGLIQRIGSRKSGHWEVIE